MAIPTKQALLQALSGAEGRYISGEQLAQTLGVSRAAIHKAAAALTTQGYRLEAAPRRGYRLLGGDPFCADAVGEYPAPVYVHERLDSSNQTAKRLALAGAPHGTLVLAGQQSAGRGRMGRRFESPAGKGIYLSLVLRVPVPASKALGVTVGAAVAVARAVQKLCGIELGIKWVNDLYFQGKKVCGILTEASLDCESGALAYAIVGIGINLTLPQTLPPELQDIMGAVFAGAQPEGDAASRLAGDVWTRFFRAYRRLPETAFLEAYRARSILIGQDVDVLRPSGPVPARAIGIDAHAGLIVRYPDGTQETLSSGEVSVRRAR